MIEASTLGLAGAAAAGLVSFLSPCVLPLVPAYVSYIAGQSLHGTQPVMDARTRLSAGVLSIFFVIGFSAVFIILGASVTALGQTLLRYRAEANIVGGIIVIAFGLFMLGLMQHVTWFHRDFRFHPHLAGGHPVGAFVLGVAFGFGWTPCIGPVLGVILTASAMQGSVSGGIALLSAYALGLGIPFVLSAVFMRELVGRLKVLRHAGRPLQIVAGVIMVLMGVAMVTGRLTEFSYWLLEQFPILGTIG
ncbi:MAG: cytochrome c biogenesis protein CcdA [Rhodocyclaceae bacterium]|nr:cytochrome c biogenesis protein CcdA [Rhodocyclaceae bacterium]